MNYYIEKTREFREMIGLVQPDAKTHSDMYQSEARELDLATTKADAADALADMVVVMSGWCVDFPEKTENWGAFYKQMETLSAFRGVNLRATFDIVHASNITKICTKDEVRGTIAKYQELGIEVEFKEPSDGVFIAYSTHDQWDEFSNDYPQGKMLKSINYKSPDWSGTEWQL